MGIDITTDKNWGEWQSHLISAYASRTMAFQRKGTGPLSKKFIAIFLQVKSFEGASNETLLQALKSLSSKVITDNRYDALAMSGHHIGIVVNSGELKQYFLSLHDELKPDGRLLLTSTSVTADIDKSENEHQSKPDIMQFQSENLIGPFFSTLRVKAETLKSQAMQANWQCCFLHYRDEDNYSALLGISST
jgi:hypothetical protein